MSALLYPDHRQAIADLIIEGVEPGKIISHEWLDQHLRLDRRSSDYPFKRLAGVEAFKTQLLVENKIHLHSIRGKGYIIVSPEDQTKVAVDEAMNGIRKSIQKGVLRLTNVDLERLSDDGRKENADAISRVAAIGGMVKRRIT
jgi:hypothetical protein